MEELGTRHSVHLKKHKIWKPDVATACSKDSFQRDFSYFFFFSLHGAVSCPPLPCYTVTIVLNVKFYFSSYLQRDFSACKPEQLIPPPLLLSWPWTRNSLCQSCFLVYFGHELQMLWAGSGSGRFCSIWLWHCWWIPSNKRIVLENNVKSTLNW